MQTLKSTVLLISRYAEVCSAVRAALESSEPSCRIASVASFAAARSTVADLLPDFIIIILGKEEPPGLAALFTAGPADFVQAGESRPPAAVFAEAYLNSARRLACEFTETGQAAAAAEATQEESFGAILRHELNNPLTGILGNAELLLAETHRQNGQQFSEPGVKRLETIAGLAVRMRETVRRLSQAFESRR